MHSTESTDREVTVVGLGYIGLPTAAILAQDGVRVTGVDTNPAHVEAVRSGKVPFVEPDLEAYVARAVTTGMLEATETVSASDVFIVAVPTPFAADHTADLRFIDSATDSIIPALKGGELIILESTSPPGTTEYVAERVLRSRPDLSLDGANGTSVVEFAHCPERVLPGRIMVEMAENDRIVGGLTTSAAERAARLYRTFCRGEIHLTDARTAELAKLTENAFRDVNIAFANELASVSDALGVDVFELISLANKHPRVNILQPGPGVGGHCIAVDPWFIISSAPKESRLIRTARAVNDDRPEQVVSEAASAIEELGLTRVALLGLAFKPDIDDLRESPAMDIAISLAGRFPQVRFHVVEPNIVELPEVLSRMGNVSLSATEEALSQAELTVLLVDHRQFKEVPAEARPARLIDTRGAWRN